MKSLKPPVVMIGYSRSYTMVKSLRRLSLCHGIEGRSVKVYLDAPYRNEDIQKCEQMLSVVQEARKWIPQLEIIRRDRNYGVPGNLLSAISETLNVYGRVIFFEDDVCVSKYFLEYMDDALDMYENEPSIFCINGHQNPNIDIPKRYPYDVYLSPRNSAWGFGIWKDRWQSVDFEMKDWGEFKLFLQNLNDLDKAGTDVKNMIESQLKGSIHTWDVQCTYHMVKNHMWSIEPSRSLTKNIGFGADGLHCTQNNPLYTHQCYFNFRPQLLKGLKPCAEIVGQFRNMLSADNFWLRLKRKVKRMFLRYSAICDEPLEIENIK